MTASRAHRCGPSPSLAGDVHAADDHASAGPARPDGAAVIPVAPAMPVAPVTAVSPVAIRGDAHLLRTTVPAHPSRAVGVRSMVAQHLTHLGLPPEHLDNAVLATDELFANAVKHGSPDAGHMITVTVECTEHDLRVTVADRSPALPRLRTAGGDEESGRGLAIVAALADDWGIAPADPGSTGKRVWFVLALRGML